MNYGAIKKTDIANGEGVRVSLFVSGCRIHCEGCFNKESQNFSYGTPFTKETEEDIMRALAKEYISGLTVLGGEPFEVENQRALTPFLRTVKERFPQKTIWCYTGYVYEKHLLYEGSVCHCECTAEMLSYIDVLVDGPFIASQADISLQFRGSKNQRILRLP